jgi:signal transduction histidine kinase
MTWYRSLYWRTAIGFMLCLAAMLVVQALVFLWVASRTGPTAPGQPPERFAETVAAEISSALEREPALDLSRLVREEYGKDAHPVLVMMTDGRMASNGGALPDDLIAQARGMLERRPPSFDRFGRGRFGRGRSGFDRDPGMDPGFRPPPDPGERRDAPEPRQGPFPGPRPDGPGGRPFGPPPGMRMRPAFIFINNDIAGVVVVPSRAPFSFLLTRYAPTFALITGGVLVVGALGAAVVIFGPAGRRLRGVEHAARKLGAGDLSARAPVQGGDEVAAVATAFNSMADDLSARAEALQASDRARRQLLADVSHELNTPVTAMRGYLETLRMPEFELDDLTRARYLGIVDDETARLERIIRDLLDLARYEGGGGDLVIGDVSVDQLFERVRARHERACQEAGVDIETVIEPGAEIISGDRDRLEQVLQNLAANALRFAPRGTAIELRARPSEEIEPSGLKVSSVAISVTDHGPGIDPEHLPHVFDRFYKADHARAQAHDTAGGSGLGLSIVKAIVERHGGTIAVKSQPGRTEFTIRL